MTIEVVLLLGGLIWGGVQIIKHTVPSYYQRVSEQLYSEAHERMDELEKKIEELTGAAK
jgi:hypothetical protein